MIGRARISKIFVGVAVCAVLAACGGGGGGGDPLIPDGGGTDPAENRLSLSVLPGATATSADVELKLSNVDPTLSQAAVGGISAELLYDPAWIAFGGVTPGVALDGGAQVRPLADDPGRLLMALEGVSEGTLGTLHFNLTGTGNTGTLAWADATLVGVTGTVLPDRLLAPAGTELSN